MEPLTAAVERNDVAVAPYPRAAAAVAAAGLDLQLVSLDRDSAETAALARALSHDERERASRFVRDVHRQRFTVARAALRQQLAERLGVNAATIEFEYAERGKPALAGRLRDALHFNVSHSDSLALYVFAQRPVGCDIERKRTMSDVERIVSRWFAPSESAEIVASDEPHELFFRYWALKEAVLKAEGAGLALLSCDFELQSDDRELFRTRGVDALSRWTAARLIVPADFAAAVAFSRSDETGVQA